MRTITIRLAIVLLIAVVEADISNDFFAKTMVKKNINEMGEELLHFSKDILKPLIEFQNQLLETKNSTGVQNCLKHSVQMAIQQLKKMLTKVVAGDGGQMATTIDDLENMNNEQLYSAWRAFSEDGHSRKALARELNNFRKMYYDRMHMLSGDMKKCGIETV